MTQMVTAQGLSQESGEFSMQEQSASKSSLMRMRHSILLLNGRSDQRGEISEMLSTRLGYQVLDTEVATEQLSDSQFSMLKPDAVIIDVATLGHSRQLVASLNALLPDTAILVLVGYGEYQIAQEYLMLGAHDFMTKPFSQERLSVTLRNVLALQDARREVRDMLRMTNQPQAGKGQLTDGKSYVSSGSIISLLNANGDIRKLGDIENVVIRFAITFYNGRISTVSRKLGVGRSTLYRKLASFDRR